MITDIHNPKYKKALFKFEQICMGAEIDYALVYQEELDDWEVLPLKEAQEKKFCIVLTCLCQNTLEVRGGDEKSN